MSEIAWAAGFFDGEGSVGYWRTGSGDHRSLTTHIWQLDRRPLDRFTEAVGLGKVYGPYQKNKWKEQFTWKAHGNDVRLLFERLRPHLSEPKFEQFEKALHEGGET